MIHDRYCTCYTFGGETVDDQHLTRTLHPPGVHMVQNFTAGGVYGCVCAGGGVWVFLCVRTTMAG